MTKWLFIGTFLSRRSGTKGIAESVAERFSNDSQLQFTLVSRKQNKIARLLEIIFFAASGSYDRIHIDVFSGPAFRIAEVATTIAKRRSKRIVLTLHGGKLHEFAENNLARIAAVFNSASHIQTPSLFLQQYFQLKGFNIAYLPNAIDLEKFPYDRSAIKRSNLLWVRAFSSIYNPDLAVKVLYEVKKKYPQASLTMIGPDKGMLPATKQIISNLGLENSVQILGPIANDQLYKFYQTHEVYLNTTSYESFGVALVEAASCGIPIVSTSVGEIPYLWQHEKNMLLTDISEQSMAAEVTRLLADPTFAALLSHEANKKATQFSWQNIRNGWEKILKVNN